MRPPAAKSFLLPAYGAAIIDSLDRSVTDGFEARDFATGKGP